LPALVAGGLSVIDNSRAGRVDWELGDVGIPETELNSFEHEKATRMYFVTFFTAIGVV